MSAHSGALKIGLSACFFHADPSRPLFKGKTLLYMEQSMAHWIMREGALVYLIPADEPQAVRKLKDLLSPLDGLVLQGGADVAPENYGETPLRPDWGGDRIRDQYEIDLVKICLDTKMPILGICRGAQLLNVALGGTLYQDIQTQVPQARVHRDWDIYDANHHEITIEPNSRLEKLYPKTKSAKVNSIHHQSVRKLGNQLKIEAKSTDDGIVESISFTGDSFAMATQWHPEFHPTTDPSYFDGRPLLQHFLDEAKGFRRKAI